MDKQIRDSDFVIMVCTETYYQRVMGDEEPGIGLRRPLGRASDLPSYLQCGVNEHEVYSGTI